MALAEPPMSGMYIRLRTGVDLVACSHEVWLSQLPDEQELVIFDQRPQEQLKSLSEGRMDR